MLSLVNRVIFDESRNFNEETTISKLDFGLE
jgi:hypothetical protein